MNKQSHEKIKRVTQDDIWYNAKHLADNQNYLVESNDGDYNCWLCGKSHPKIVLIFPDGSERFYGTQCWDKILSQLKSILADRRK